MHSQLATLVFLLATGFCSLGVYGWTDSQSLSRHRVVRRHVERAVHHNLTKRGGGKKGYCSSQKATVANVKGDTGVPASLSRASTTSTTTPADQTPATHGGKSPGGSTLPDDGGSPGSSKTFSGDATYYGIGLGACGWTNKEPDMIAAVSHELFDSYATTAAAKDNSNLNPICGRMAHATIGGLGSCTVKIVDRCVGCSYGDLDFSMAAFDQVTNNGEAFGRYTNMTWHWA